MEGIFSDLKDAKSETLLVIDCEGIVFSYMDSAFLEENKSIWKDFSKKRSGFVQEKNRQIDRALFHASKRIFDMKDRQGLKNLLNQGINMIFVYQVNEDRMKFRDELMIKSFLSSVLDDLGPDKNSSVKLLVTDSKNISSDIAKIIKEIETVAVDSKSKKENLVKKVFFVHNKGITLDDKLISQSINDVLINFSYQSEKITKEQIMRQMEILEKTGEWMDDYRIQRIMKLSDEDLIYELCKQSIMDVCPCREIIEDNIYEKIASIVRDKNTLTQARDIIDDFQDVFYTLHNIFHYVLRMHFWETCLDLGLTEQKAVEILKKIKGFYFDEYEAREVSYKILRNIGCGIHWRDMAKYEFLRNFVKNNEKIAAKETDSSRFRVYMKVLNAVFDRVSERMKHTVEDLQTELIKLLYENKIDDKKIIDIFKISEEKFKNITSESSLKNEEVKMEEQKKLKKSEKGS